MDFFGNVDTPGGLFAQLAQGFGGPLGPRGVRPPPRAFDEYLKAHSLAMLPGRERENVSYGGKIIMPPSALANITRLDLESPWMFQLRNPSNPAASTHAGVLEFIADEGVVHLPYWMMKTLRLDEGDPIRITGAELPKGKFVKLQAQTVHFLEISDPKAVLEQALRNFTALTQGDIIEIYYNSMVFGFLVMETVPNGGGICVLDTDLEVDFAPPVGYVEPERPKAPPPSTMASKLNIDLNSSSPGSSRPSSSLAGGFVSGGTAAVSKGGDHWESFKGKGETLSGRKTKGKGISHRAVEEVADGSKIMRTDRRTVVTSDSLESDAKVPAALNLPFGKLFFGFRVVPYTPPVSDAQPPAGSPSPPVTFSGPGNKLSGRAVEPSSTPKGKERAKSPSQSSPSSNSWGGGQTLGSRSPLLHVPSGFRSRELGGGGLSVSRRPNQPRRRSPTPDWGVDDDDIIEIDSD
ncbi:UFD1-domain-containing protein [Pisolithus orientalis]|uniref:UFD1-domain-containing protein n=1 Tax=Pisolithus orientalis TaxID=936130 RepID=UPI0022259915|nr:UFD1-domain-containing protein [Pisolithus orientalis]KAI6028653.1 UFD1-domain-containing protein [Pisolithus orientalis]